MMRRMLGLRSGRAGARPRLRSGQVRALRGAGRGARACGIDIAPFFLPRALETVDLVRRRPAGACPFARASFPKAYTLDVLEHLDEEGVCEVLVEARRVPSSRAARSSSIRTRWNRRAWRVSSALTNRLARRLGAWGLVDHEREAMRKSDHVNAIRSHEHFDELCARAGLCVYKRRYYNVVFKAADRRPAAAALSSKRLRAQAAFGRGSGEPAGQPRGAPSVRRRPGRLARSAATLLTWPLWLDPLLFGRIRTGPFFGLLRARDGRPRGGTAA